MRPPGNIVGPQISRLREAQGLSQAALAAKCQRLGWDISRDVLARIEGQIRLVTDTELVFLARSLAVSVDGLLPKEALDAVLESVRKGSCSGV